MTQTLLFYHVPTKSY